MYNFYESQIAYHLHLYLNNNIPLNDNPIDDQ